MNKESLDILKKVFDYFAGRTNGTLQSAKSSSTFMLLQKSNLDFAFTRAVVYALLRDPDQVLYGRENPMFRLMTVNFTVVGGEKCTNCKKLNPSATTAINIWAVGKSRLQAASVEVLNTAAKNASNMTSRITSKIAYIQSQKNLHVKIQTQEQN